MNSTLSPCTSELEECGIADSRSDTLSASEIALLMRVNYVTLPMPVCKAESVVLDEEAVYTSFEQAISERWQSHYAACTGSRMRQEACGHTRQSVNTRRYARQVRAKKSVALAPTAASRRSSRRSLSLLIMFGLLCLLVGFDLMGLLILTLH